MLRCPPSRINLGPSDIAGLDRRLAARQSARAAQPRRSNVRLSPGPCHPTRLAIVPAEDDIGPRCAASSSSKALLYNNGNDPSEEGLPVTFVSNGTGAWAIDTPTTLRQQPLDQSVLCTEVARALARVALQRLSPPKASPRRQVDSFYGEELDGHVTPEAPIRSLSVTPQNQVGQASAEEAPSILASSLSNAVLREIDSDAYPVQRQPQSDPRPLSSARARRRNARGQAVYHCPQELQELTYARHMHKDFSRNGIEAAVAPSPVPELESLGEPALSSTNLALDPGAPVFIPRTRFGTTIESSTDGGTALVEPQWSSLDSIRSSNQRTRSSSEQNIDPSPHHPELPRGSVDGLIEVTNARINDAAYPRHRYRSMTANQSTTIPPPTPNLERYPLLRPPSSLTSQHRTSGSHRHIPVPGRNFSRPSWSASHQFHAGATFDRRQTSLQVQNMSMSGNADPAEQASWIRSVSPTFSTSSQSTPNLLCPPHSAPRIHSRTSSLSWHRAASGISGFNRLPSMVSAASGVSCSGVTTRQSSREGLDAAAEFLRMRNSPLDDLTERFSRLAASRPRSVGRSWERIPSRQPRISLLTGDPFRQDSSSDPLSMYESMLPETVPDPIHQEIIREVESEGEDPVALSLALPPSSPLPSSPRAAPSTPLVVSGGLSSPHSPLASQSSAHGHSSPESAIKRKPVPTAIATPRVKVYNDSKPPNTQPQTPADVSRSKRRAKTRSNTTVHESPIFVGRVIMSSPPLIPERNPHRNTYHSATPAQTISAKVNITSADTPRPPTSVNIPEHERRERTRHRGQRQRSSEQVENDLEGHLDGLEQDRRTWVGPSGRRS